MFSLINNGDIEDTVSGYSQSQDALADTGAFGVIPERMRISGDSPYRDRAVVDAVKHHSIVGSTAIDASPSHDFGLMKIVPQRRPLCSSTMSLTRSDYKNQLQAFLTSDERRAIKLMAQTGAGKSTAFPAAIYQIVNRPILVVEPNTILASNGYSYVKKTYMPTVGLLNGKTLSGHRDGVVYVNANTLLSLAVNNSAQLERYAVIYIDECHDTSANYYVLRCLFFEYKGSAKVIYASATIGEMNEESHGGTHEKSHKSIRDVDAEGLISTATAADPWHYRAVRNRCMIFVNTQQQCQSVAAWYTNNGVRSGVLHEGTTAGEYAALFYDLDSSQGTPFVLCTTAVAETGVTLPVDSVIDLRTKEYVSFDLRRRLMSNAIRRVTNNEALQRAGRVGRMFHGVYHGMAVEFTVFDELDPNEELRAYLWLRLLGYTPLHDVFAAAKSYLEPISLFGCAQILNCMLHPGLTRRYLDFDGRFYSNFIGINDFMMHGTVAYFSQNAMDVDNQVSWFDYSLVHANINRGRPVSTKLPLNPSSSCLTQMCHIAFESLKWNSNRGPRDITFSAQGDLGAKAVVNRADSIFSVRNPEPAPQGPKAKKSKPKVVTRVKPIESDEVSLHYLQVEEAPKKPKYTTQDVTAQVAAAVKKMAEFHESHPVPVVQPAYKSESRRRKPQAQVLSESGMVQPMLLPRKYQDFALADGRDYSNIDRLLKSEILLSQITHDERTRVHDAFCRVWNSNYLKLIYAEKTEQTFLEKHNYNPTSVMLASVFGHGRRVKKNLKKYRGLKIRMENFEENFIAVGLEVTAYVPVAHASNPGREQEVRELVGRAVADMRRDPQLNALLALFASTSSQVRRICQYGFHVGVCLVSGTRMITVRHVIEMYGSRGELRTMRGFGMTVQHMPEGGLEFGEIVVCNIAQPYEVCDWIKARPPRSDDLVTRLWRTNDGDTDEGVGFSPKSPILILEQGRVLYEFPSQPGHSGSPVFSLYDCCLVGFHHGAVGDRSVFVPIDLAAAEEINRALSG